MQKPPAAFVAGGFCFSRASRAPAPLRRILFTVDGLDVVVARMQAHGAELIGQMQYESSYRQAYIRGPDGIIVKLAEQLG